MSLVCFFFNDTATTEIYTLSLHDALPIFAVLRGEEERQCRPRAQPERQAAEEAGDIGVRLVAPRRLFPQPSEVCDEFRARSEEHTSELQSRQYLVCRLLLEKKT